ncbi:Acetyltransferase (GNAT) domain protein [compost metagenome]
MDYRFQWLDSLDSGRFPERDYVELCDRTPQASPFNHLGWLRAAERTLAPDQGLQVLLAWNGARLALCLPLLVCRERKLGLRWTVLHHLGYPLADRIALLCELDDDGLRAARRHIHAHLPHALLQLNEVQDSGEQRRLFQQWAGVSSTHEQRPCCNVPVHRISDADLREPSGDVRYKLRRARKRCASIGAQVRRVVPDAASIAALLDTLAEVEHRSWKGDEGVGIFSGDARQLWIRQGFSALAAAGLVRVVMLELEGRCLSYRLGLLHQDRLYDYNLAFLPEHAELGIGRLLLDEWIRWGLEEGWQWIDASRVSFSGSGHQLHERMTDFVEQQRWSFYSRRPDGLALGLAYRTWRRFKAWRRAVAAKRSGKGGLPCPAK